MSPNKHREPSAWQRLGKLFRFRRTRAHIGMGLLTFLLGFGVMLQINQTNFDQYAVLGQDELIRLLDESSTRSTNLQEEVRLAKQQRDELERGFDSVEDAERLATEQATNLAILSGTIPVSGPGFTFTISKADEKLTAAMMFQLLEELRNAGAEAIAVNDIRVTGRSFFLSTPGDAMLLDGEVIEQPYKWQVIGDADTIVPALQIPSGIFSTMRVNAQADIQVRESDEVIINVVAKNLEYEFAEPVVE